MFVSRLSRWLGQRQIHYAWVVAGLTFLTMIAMSAALGLPGAMMPALSREFGWTTEQISSTLALRFALYGVLGPFAAVLIERFGLRSVMCLGLSLVGGGMLMAAVSTQLWQLFVAWSLMLGVGTGLTALVLGAVVANRWFAARRGLVMGVLSASAATGQLAFLPVAAWMIEHLGWRSAVVPIVVAALLIGVLVWLLAVDRPEDLGMSPFGSTEPAGAAQAAARLPKATFATPFLTLKEASGNGTFWILAGSFFVCGLSTNGLIQTHFISLCGDNGLGTVPAASILAMMGAFDFIGTISSGWLSDRYDNRKLLFWYYGLRGLSLIWLPHSGFSLYGLTVFALFYGLDWLATVPPTVKLAGTVFGVQRAGLVFGWIFAAHQVGAAVAAYGGGLSRTLLLTYTPALYAAGGACIFAALVVLMIRKSREGAAGVPVGAAKA